MRASEFAPILTHHAVTHRAEPFVLSGGGQSSWYVDHRAGLFSNDRMAAATGLLVRKARVLGITYDVVAGGGVGGNSLAIATAWRSQGKTSWVIANLDRTDNDAENGYGLHGADVAGRRVLAVDDIGSTGKSLLELIAMVRARGGMVSDSLTVTDRSNGLAGLALSEIGVSYASLFRFNESRGRLEPMVERDQVAQRRLWLAEPRSADA